MAELAESPLRRPRMPGSDGEVVSGRTSVSGEADRVFAPFAGIRFTADAVHGDGEHLVGLAPEGSQGHAPGAEAVQDGLDGFDRFEGNRGAVALNSSKSRSAAGGRERI